MYKKHLVVLMQPHPALPPLHLSFPLLGQEAVFS